VERVKYELGIINSMGYANYYLIVRDLVEYARANNIPVGPGRGSGAGSFVAYLTRITDLDPIKHQLIFERFLNPERASMPDFDLDFADDKRDEVIKYCITKYGEEHVAQIITFGTMKARAAVKDVGRVLDIPYQETDHISKLIPFGMTLDEALEQNKELQLLSEKDPQVKKLLDLSKRLEGVARHASTHAAAVVVSKNKLVCDIPLQKDSKEGKITTQYSAKPAEEIGLLKIDFLGLRNLTILGNALEVIKEHTGHEIDLDHLPLDEPKVYETLSNGETMGVFQIESPGMVKLARDMGVNNFDDIVALIALFRPGPMNMLGDYIAAKHGEREPVYPHPSLEPILKDTYGIAIYQEQVQQIACDFAGFSLGQGYLLIKAIGKKIIAQIKKMKKSFIEGAMQTSQVSKKKATEVFSFIEPFARYGFNKSHAACYGLLTYQTAYLKTVYPLEYMTALLTSEMENQEKLAVYIADCKRLGIEILPPDINQSQLKFSIQDGKIRFGLLGIKNVGSAALESILASRSENSFSSLPDFCSRINSRCCNRKIVESLIKSGAMEEFGNRNQLLQSLDQVLDYALQAQRARDCGQISLFGDLEASGGQSDICPLPMVEDIDLTTKLAWEKELMGCYISQHPLSMFSSQIKSSDVKLISQIGSDPSAPKEKVKIIGIVRSVKKIFTRKKDQMAFVEFEDETGSIELIIFPKA
ncbi:MAG TPA: DNA polymerase III subunit alpha, partial [Candidatus Wirthbacteria bacterium]|nr:DNA polymerase III subunit alpha [Candidatus Wirthbacteria bacterium]